MRTTTSADSAKHGEAFDIGGRGDFVRLAYRLGRGGATGILTVRVPGPPGQRPEVLVLRRGFLMTTDADTLGRIASARLARLAGASGARAVFDGGTAAYPPAATARRLHLAQWARTHLEGQIDTSRADQLVTELAGVRLAIRPEHAPDATLCDDTDRRILAAMAQPRRLDQIWPLARTPRFRLLAFIHFLRTVGALTLVGVAVQAPVSDHRRDARRLLGIGDDASDEVAKRAYRRLARAFHPDLHPDVDALQRRSLEVRFAEVTAAYQRLVQRA